MGRGVLTPVARWLLLVAVLLGVVLMHHVLTGRSAPAAATVAAPAAHTGHAAHAMHGMAVPDPPAAPQDPPMPGHDHGGVGLHLCLAVLLGALLLVAAGSWWRRLPAPCWPRHRAPRPPVMRRLGKAPPSGWDLLLRTCVSRR